MIKGKERTNVGIDKVEVEVRARRGDKMNGRGRKRDIGAEG